MSHAGTDARGACRDGKAAETAGLLPSAQQAGTRAEEAEKRASRIILWGGLRRKQTALFFANLEKGKRNVKFTPFRLPAISTGSKVGT